MFFGGIRLFSGLLTQPLCRVDQYLQIFRIQVLRQSIQLVYKLRIVNLRRKEFLQCNAKVFANVEQLRYRWKRLAGGNTLNISLAVPQIEAHLVLRNALLYTQFGNPCPDKTAVQTHHLIQQYCIPLKEVIIRLKIPILIEMYLL